MSNDSQNYAYNDPGILTKIVTYVYVLFPYNDPIILEFSLKL